jgi:single-stranded DNA-binding protein
MWVDVSMAGKHAQAISSYLAKGGYVTVSGQVGIRKYKNKEGVEQVTMRLSAFKCTLQGKSSAVAAIPAVVNPARPAQPYPQEDGFAPDAGADFDDIPF